MKAVLDTNVLVSGLLTRQGVCARIIDRMRVGAFRLCVNGEIVAEYAEVLCRAELSIPPGTTSDFLDFVRHRAQRVDAALLTVDLPDEADRPFLEVAAAADALLVTGNIRHFPKNVRGGVVVVRPAEFVELLQHPA